MLMPFLVKALLENRARHSARAAEIGIEAAIAEDPRAKGYLRAQSGYRLFEKREALTGALLDAVRENGEWLMESLEYPLGA
jgi:deoxyhypusine synthase